jgi:FkbM family methyltransferase
MANYTTREDEQYFEEFLNLKPSGESFVNIGGYDGFTSEEFIKLCPNFSHIDIFEPDEQNLLLAKKRLNRYTPIRYHQFGLSDHQGIVHFSHAGSSSSINTHGEQEIHLNKLDDVCLNRQL